MNSDSQGILLCGRYAFSPNYYHYCGPEKQTDLRAYITEHISDRGLVEILSEFDTLYTYLLLIASENGITDPFDRRVVDAYWLGNTLVTRVKKTAFVQQITEGISLKKKMVPGKFNALTNELMNHGMPTHTDHVVSIFIRTGHHAIAHTLSTMDQCRISWGKVIRRLSPVVQGNTHITQWVVQMMHLTYTGEMLSLGPPDETTVVAIGIDVAEGEWVSIHWGHICEVLTPIQLKNIIRFTHRALHFTHMSL